MENVIERCFLLQDLLANDSLRRVVGRIGRLPATPQVYARLQSALAAPDVTADDIGRIVNADAAIANKVLQITNSSFFRLRKPIVRIKDAVTYLGFATIRNLVMSAEIFAQWKMPAALSGAVAPEHLQRHAQAAAQACKSLATGKVSPDDAWLAGLVHDIGYAPDLVKTGSHAFDGARYLRDVMHADERLCRLVANHTYAIVEARRRGLAEALAAEFPIVDGLVADALVYCDMTTSPGGDQVDVRARLSEILERYGAGDIVSDSIAEAMSRIIQSVQNVMITQPGH